MLLLIGCLVQDLVTTMMLLTLLPTLLMHPYVGNGWHADAAWIANDSNDTWQNYSLVGTVGYDIAKDGKHLASMSMVFFLEHQTI